ncbi:MAG: GNAT family N-acetyltransferase [Pseudomonadota bacterium]
MTVILETDRLTLRRPNGTDAEAAIAFYGSDRSQYVGGPVGRGEGWRKLAMFAGHWDLRGYGLFSIVPKGADRAIGLVGPWHPINWPETEIGWQIWSDAYEGQGFAKEAAIVTRDYARCELGWSEIVSYIDPNNQRSIALAEKLGARRDETARLPDPHDETTCWVYRHPVVSK